MLRDKTKFAMELKKLDQKILTLSKKVLKSSLYDQEQTLEVIKELGRLERSLGGKEFLETLKRRVFETDSVIQEIKSQVKSSERRFQKFEELSAELKALKKEHKLIKRSITTIKKFIKNQIANKKKEEKFIMSTIAKLNNEVNDLKNKMDNTKEALVSLIMPKEGSI
jgi:chromosome segregation ATPase